MEPNELIGDRYELGDPIGRGGMATIYRATDLRMGRPVAIKILRDVYSTDPKFVTRFQREARAASALQHPNIVQVFDYGQSGESYYIVMELVDGADLRRYLKREGILAPDRAIAIAHDVALGLGAAHRRSIVHRDVKPQNVLLNDDGLVKLTDFGIASMYKDAEAERLTTTGMTLGTVQYYAPEQAQGEIVSPAADIYALGIVMYEMLTSKTPFDGDTPVAVAMRHIQDMPEPPSALNPAIPPGLERIIMRCLEKDPRDRYRDGDALAYALENFMRAPQKRVGTSAPGTRGQFGPLGLPSATGRPPAGRASQFGASGVVSGPRGGVMAPPQTGAGNGRMLDDPYDPPTFEDPYAGAVSTRPWGPAGGTAPRISGPHGMPPEEDEEPKRRTGLIVGLLGGGLVMLLAACIGLFMVTGVLGNPFIGAQATPVARYVTVPNFVGQQFLTAKAQAEAMRLTVNQVQVADPAPVGQVVKQDVPPGTSVKENAPITLSISAGPGTIAVPDVSNLTIDQACSKLSQANLNCFQDAEHYQFSATVPENSVIGTDPKTGTQVAPGSKVTLIVSKGPQPTPTVPPQPSPSPTVPPQPSPTPTTPPPSGGGGGTTSSPPGTGGAPLNGDGKTP